MSDRNNIDQLIRDKFAGHKLPVNEAHWASTEAFIDAQRRKKRRAVVFLFLGLLLVSSISYLAIDHLKKPDSTELVFTENSSSEKGLNETKGGPFDPYDNSQNTSAAHLSQDTISIEQEDPPPQSQNSYLHLWIKSDYNNWPNSRQQYRRFKQGFQCIN